jgi:hypothetical protein
VGNALAMAAWALGNSTGAEAGDTDLKAIQFVAEWLRPAACTSRTPPRWTAWTAGARSSEAGETTSPGACSRHVLEKALDGENYDRQKTLRRMDDEGLLVNGGSGKRFTRQRRHQGRGRIWCVCIDNDALAAFLLDGGTGGAGATSGSSSVTGRPSVMTGVMTGEGAGGDPFYAWCHRPVITYMGKGGGLARGRGRAHAGGCCPIGDDVMTGAFAQVAGRFRVIGGVMTAGGW